MSTDDTSATASAGPVLSEGLDPEERAKLDALLDHIYEYGTDAEGVTRLAAQLCEAARAAERERWRGLLMRALPMLREYADYADSAPVWHCTGHAHNTLVKLIPEIEAALGPNH